MKRLLLILIATVVFGNLFAITEEKEKTITNSEPTAVTVSVNGQVVDKETGEVLTGAYVQIEGTDLFTYTDFEGSFTFNNLKPGNYTALVSFISYEKNKISIETSTKKDIKIELKATSIK